MTTASRGVRGAMEAKSRASREREIIFSGEAVILTRYLSGLLARSGNPRIARAEIQVRANLKIEAESLERGPFRPLPGESISGPIALNFLLYRFHFVQFCPHPNLSLENYHQAKVLDLVTNYHDSERTRGVAWFGGRPYPRR